MNQNLIKRNLWQKLGPGLLYAGAAVGVSHLVQSTRAGADFGYQLVWAVILANILKYPFFDYGPRYTAATGKSILHGYKEVGNWAVYLFILLTIGTMFIIQSAVTVVTAGIASELFNIDLPIAVTSTILLVICGAILMKGRYGLLDKLGKTIILILTIATIICLVSAFFSPVEYIVSKGNSSGSFFVFREKLFDFSNYSHLMFLVALMGWMPAPMEISIWHSIWSEAKNKDSGKKTSEDVSSLDFNIGFWGTMVLALCFLSLGSIVMYGSGRSFSPSAVKFASELINLYTTILGTWAYPFIATAALFTMFSTTITCLDAFPRSLGNSIKIIRNDEKTFYNINLIIVIAGSALLLFYFMKNMKALVDFATTMSFVTAPLIAILSFVAIHKAKKKGKVEIPKAIDIMAWVGMTALTLFSIYYLTLRF